MRYAVVDDGLQLYQWSRVAETETALCVDITISGGGRLHDNVQPNALSPDNMQQRRNDSDTVSSLAILGRFRKEACFVCALYSSEL